MIHQINVTLLHCHSPLHQPPPFFMHDKDIGECFPRTLVANWLRVSYVLF